MGCIVSQQPAVNMGCIVSQQPDFPALRNHSDEIMNIKNIFEKHFHVDKHIIEHSMAFMKMKKLAARAKEVVAAKKTAQSVELIETESSSSSYTADSIFHFKTKKFTDERRAETQSRETKIKEGSSLLSERLVHLGLQQLIMKDDGNCQFRAFSDQLYGTQERHLEIRQTIVKHMNKYEADFEIYFEDKNMWASYLRDMSAKGCWGDELTLRCAADVFNVKVHVLTSEQKNYYIHYDPALHSEKNCGFEQQPVEDTNRHVFLSYISPVHYNSIHLDLRKVPTPSV